MSVVLSNPVYRVILTCMVVSRLGFDMDYFFGQWCGLIALEVLSYRAWEAAIRDP